VFLDLCDSIYEIYFVLMIGMNLSTDPILNKI